MATILVAAFLGIGGVIALSAMPKDIAPRQSAAPPPAPKPTAPADIVLAAPPAEPVTPVDTRENSQQTETDKPEKSFTVSVDDDSGDAASRQAEWARQAENKGDLEQALRLMRRAAALAPNDVLYRLQLATLYDRAGKKDGALQLYRQVLQACDSGSVQTPQNVDMDSVRRRAAWLASEPR